MDEEIYYDMFEEGDNTLKSFFKLNYVIPKVLVKNESDKEVIERLCTIPSAEEVLNGENGYIVFKKTKILSDEEVEIIKNDVGSQREKAEKYGVSVGTINKIMNNKY